jgi:hypothetical protein
MASDSNIDFTVNGWTCTPKTCANLGYNCGTVSDGCSGSLNCGTCPSSQTCGNNKCVVAQTCTPTAVSSCKVCKADGSAWVDDSTKCGSGQVCQSGVCVSQILVLDVPYSQLDAMGCGTNANPQANSNCRASRFCATKGFNSGFQIEWGPAAGTIVCLPGNILNVAYSALDATGCGTNANPAANNACRASRYCGSKGYVTGFETEWAPNGATIQCLKKANKLDVDFKVLDSQGCGDDPNGFKHQACNASRYCASKGYTSGFQTEWGLSGATVFCLNNQSLAIADGNSGAINGIFDNLQASLATIRSQIQLLLADLSAFGQF